ncbi:uncharacterized protein [Littorina saxatilis]|uniref:uncharacterized protein n=1 Tax=Littorina saxatilis TaxID=31220 RepID=UPI0038B4EB23
MVSVRSESPPATMEGGAEETRDSPTSLSADYYYTKALDYLSSSADSGSGSCLHSPSSSPTIKDEDEMDTDNFSLSFRPGLTHDDIHSSFSSGGSSSRGSDVTSTHSSASSTLHRERKLSIGCKAYQHKTGSDPRVRRKLSDGHVHWADEFQKDLTRSHPRKQYSRHPSHQTGQVKPILKSTSADCEQ